MTSFPLHLPPFRFKINTDIPEVVENVKTIYGPHCVTNDNPTGFSDYHLDIKNASGIRKLYRKQARFLCDHREPFKPLSYGQAYALLEWGMNWTIAAHEMQFVIVHAGILAKNGKAVLFPAPPGSGKSTLTTHLAFNGWQLLSDEMALVEPMTNTVIPFVRPICLKNQSIALAKQWFPDATFSTIARDTHKGDVIHLSPPQSSWQMRHQAAQIVGVVFPNFRPDQAMQIYQLTHAETLMQLADNAFNYSVLGEIGFKTLIKIVEQSHCFEIFHNNLNDVQQFLEEDIISDG